MKRNLSSQAVKAMAIGMAVALGSTTALSGVVGGTVVEVFADNSSQNIAEATASFDSSNLTITLTSSNNFSGSSTSDTLVLKTADDTEIFNKTVSSEVSASDTTTLTITISKSALTQNTLNGKVDSLKLTYTAESGGITLNSSDLSLTDIVVTCSDVNIDNTAPTIEETAVYDSSANTITLTASEELAELSETSSANTYFTIARQGNNGTETVTADKVKVDTSAATKIVITLSAPTQGTALEDGTYKVTYSSELAGIKDKSENKLATSAVATFTVAETQKKITKAELSEAKDKITLTVNGVATQAGTAVASEFKISGTSAGEKTVSELAISEDTKTITLTLSEALADATDLKLSYAPADSSNCVKVDDKVLFLSDLKVTQASSEEVPGPETPQEVTEFTFANDFGTYSFKVNKASEEVTKEDAKTVTLTDFKAAQAAARTANVATKFENGVATVGEATYTLTQIGNGTDALAEITDQALAGQTANVTTISASAFAGAKITDASFPKVTSVGANAFKDSTVKTLDLGSKAGSAVTVDATALANTKNLTSVTTNDASKTQVSNAVKKSGSTQVVIKNESGSVIDTIKPSTGGGSSSSGSSSSNGFTGSGANVGTSSNANNNNNNNNTTQTPSENTSNEVVVENKALTLDVISLPQVSDQAKSFSDVANNHWAKSYIDKLSSAGILNGSNGVFNPNGQTKRADVTIMLVNLLGLTPEANNRFSDVEANAYYAPYVGTASTYGIVNGSNGKFNPQSVISRQDTMVMISQILKSLDLNVDTDASVLNQFSDSDKISGYAKESVAVLVNSGIISGNNGKLNPTAPVTRAEMATIMSKLYDILANANK